MNPICAQYEQGIGQKADLSGKLVRLFGGVVSSRFYTTTFLVGWCLAWSLNSNAIVSGQRCWDRWRNELVIFLIKKVEPNEIVRHFGFECTFFRLSSLVD